jgi:hypothetical protein
MRGRQYLSRRGLGRHGAVLAGALLTLLSRHRRHQSRHRPPPWQVPGWLAAGSGLPATTSDAGAGGGGGRGDRRDGLGGGRPPGHLGTPPAPRRAAPRRRWTAGRQHPRSRGRQVPARRDRHARTLLGRTQSTRQGAPGGRLVEGGVTGLELLREATAVLSDSPAMLERAEALIDFGAALRRANRRADARAPLREGLDLAHRCGAAPLEQRAHDELLAAGARPRRLALSGVESLTPNEQRIAAMAAQAMTNRDIAQALFVTPRPWRCTSTTSSASSGSAPAANSPRRSPRRFQSRYPASWTVAEMARTCGDIRQRQVHPEPPSPLAHAGRSLSPGLIQHTATAPTAWPTPSKRCFALTGCGTRKETHDQGGSGALDLPGWLHRGR